MAPREYDVVVWGATGFTGALLCGHLARLHQGGRRWAMAGRDLRKLEGARSRLAADVPACKDVPLLAGSNDDPASLDKIAASAKVVLSTTGPFELHGTPILEACIRAGTHYADITGEVAWMAHTVARFHKAAAAAGVKIVHCCGWDCIPADLGALLLVEHAKRELKQEALKVTHLITELRGSFSGGSLTTALGFYAAPRSSLFPHPYSLNPPRDRSGPDGQQSLSVGWEAISGLFTSPSIFAPANLRVTRRSAALLRPLYGAGFSFEDVMGHASWLKAFSATASTLLTGCFLLLAARLPPLAAWLRKTSHKPGEGPSAEEMAAGGWKCRLSAALKADSTQPRHLTAVFEGEGDPGYLQTSRMLLEAGLCLADGAASPFCLKGGVLTPASGIGLPLVARLQAAGMRFEVLDGKQA